MLSFPLSPVVSLNRIEQQHPDEHVHREPASARVLSFTDPSIWRVFLLGPSMIVQLAPLAIQRFVDNNNNPLAAGQLYTYEAGTTTPVATYTDYTGVTANQNPVPLNARGEASVWLTYGQSYKFVLQDANGNMIWTQDQIGFGNLPGINVVVSNIAGLRSLLKIGTPTALVLGYYASGDGGGGVYYLNPSDTTSADNGGTIIVANDGGRWHLQAIGPVSVRQFGAKGDGSTDDTARLQAALNAGLLSLYVPDGIFLTTGLVMPLTVGFVLFGNGTNSIIKQLAGGTQALRYPVNSTNNFYSQGFIRSLSFNGTNGSANTLDTSYCGGLTLEDIYFTDTPSGFSSLYINGSASVYTHDIRVRGLQIYSNVAGSSGVTCGPTASDVTISDYYMNGNFIASHALDYVSGAQSIRVSSSHLYNTASNIALLEGNNGGSSFNDTVFDNSHADNVYNQNNAGIVFANCRFQAVSVGNNGLTNNNCTNTILVGCKWDGVIGAHSCVYDFGTTAATVVLGGVLDTPSNFTPDFNLAASSIVRFVDNNNPLGISYFFAGCTTSPVAQNTTAYLGLNGAQNGLVNTEFPNPYNGTAVVANIYCDVTPAAGQTFTFTVLQNGASIGTGTISNGSFIANITLTASVSLGDTLAIKVVTSATSGAANFRYNLQFSA
ncbi:glycosyl hydrolase family 28-related protein [Paraburkholderia sediminicola]|uniref:glycosyl hydrolase family 28-related protein n=1 Tax=Paraburkholderia sediminicola TaxID=458836 RepID=UPI0038BBE346